MPPAPRRPPRRILHLSPSFFPAHRYGGPVAALYDLCRAQIAAGLSVRVLTSDAAGQIGGRRQRLGELSGQWTNEYGVPTFYGRVAFGEDIAPELLPALLRQLAWADVVHVTGLFSPTSLLGILGAVLTFGRCPCVVSPRGSLLPWALAQHAGRKKVALALLSPLLQRVAGWHATSDEEAAAIAALLPAKSAAAIVVVPNGVNLPHIPSPISPPPFVADAVRIIALGRVHPIKNLELAIDALCALRRTVPQASLHIVGPEQPAYGATLRQKARTLGLFEAVHFVGERSGDAKFSALREAAVLWLCSHMESFGNVVLEALAAGTPVVAAQTTPWSSLPALGGGAWVASSAEAFAEATQKLLAEQTNAEARIRVAERCRAIVAERFSWAAAEAGMRALYERLV